MKKNYIIAICGVVVLLCLGVHLVRSEQITRLAADYDDLSVRRTRILKNLKFASEIDADLVEMKSMLEEVEGRLFSPEDLATNQRYFYQIESSTGVEMTSIQQLIKPLPVGKKNKKERKRAERSQFQEIVYDMALEGTYREVLAFLRELEGGEAFSALDGFSLVSAKKLAAEPEVSMRLTLNVFGKKS
ncbi:hypothetical protein VDG1235_4169 [Verrucomicrobiia bacterium DG1235]|nr:hypothetical protein VDG1235_4169 [Verrucomicrobiae bacterium DG1235]